MGSNQAGQASPPSNLKPLTLDNGIIESRNERLGGRGERNALPLSLEFRMCLFMLSFLMHGGPQPWEALQPATG